MKKQYPPEEFTSDAMPVNQQEDEDIMTVHKVSTQVIEDEKAAAWAEFEAEMRMLNMENDFLNYK